MPSTYTTSLGLTLPATGELSGTWGVTVNTGITALVDDSVAGTASITMVAADYTLSATQGSSNEARKMFLTLGGTPGAARNVIVPAVSKLYFVFNNTTGGFAQTVKTSAGTGISVASGERRVLYCDGTNVVNALNALSLAAPLPTTSGGTGLSSFTANQVFYASSTSAIGQSANLTFDGTTLGTAAISSISASGVLNRAAATQDGVALVGRAGGTSSFLISLTPTTLTASRTVTLPDAATTVPIATQQLTFSGPTAARTITLPDSNTTVPSATQLLTFSGPTAARTITLPDSNTTVPSATQLLTFSGPTAARTITLPDANFTVARTDAANTFSGTQTFSGSVVPGTNVVDSVGYTGMPQNAQSAAYTLVAADAGKTIVHPITDNNARTFTIPANGTVAYPVGTAITFINLINTVTIAITTDTMYLAGAGTTGSRTLAAYGVATAIKVTSTSWIISGNGLT